jgi:phosphoribosylamine--glycine ligase
VLVLGGGAREHALVWACRQSVLPEAVLCAPGNGGTCAQAENVALRADDADGVTRLVRDRAIELVVLGPEAAVAAGIADRCAELGVACFGPTRDAGRIESSKAFAKQLMDGAGIPTARWQAGGATARGDLLAFARELGGACVVKADGLAAGKGVAVCDDIVQAARALDACLRDQRFGEAGATVVVEERLAGREVTVQAFCDGENVRMLPPACDYKRALEGGRGENTGGMGAYAPPLHLDPEALLETARVEVMEPAVAALAARGTPYRGCLYAGLMLTMDGPRVLEFNAHFGDPEAQVVLPLVAEDIVELMGACAVGSLPAGNVRLHGGAAVGVVLASAGYPGAVTTGHVISGLEQREHHHGHVFHGGTVRAADGTVRTAGGRVVTVVGRGDDVAEARRRAYGRAADITFTGVTSRGDIGVP